LRKPNFSSYTVEELLDCKQNIDKAKWPDRYQEIKDVISERVKNPENKRTHDEIAFAEHFEELVDDLGIAIDDNLWPFLGMFSKRIRNSLPSTFDGQVCPICSNKLDIVQKHSFWVISCHKCALSHAIQERPNVS